MAHNGNLVNIADLRRGILQRGIHLKSSTDSEVMAQMLATTRGDSWEERLAKCMGQWVGAFSILILTPDRVLAARDPWGMRPLAHGRLNTRVYAIASETCALEAIECTAVREVKPGEIITIDHGMVTVQQGHSPAYPLAHCSFEQIYFSRPDSIFADQLVYQVRQRLGHQLAIEAPVDADLVIPIPDSSIPAAIAYASQAGITYQQGIVKNSYVGRTFTLPSTAQRTEGASIKLMPVPGIIYNQRVVIIDDSIVRGITVGNLIGRLKRAGVREIHVRIASPPIRHPCFMGIDIGDYSELIARDSSVSELASRLGVDSLYFLSLDGLSKAIGGEHGYCYACFNGQYPFEIDPSLTKEQFEQSIWEGERFQI